MPSSLTGVKLTEEFARKVPTRTLSVRGSRAVIRTLYVLGWAVFAVGPLTVLWLDRHPSGPSEPRR